MNKRLEDKMAMLAFGELSEQEAAEMRALAARDPAAARLLATYESMRDGLRGLGEHVPSDQLSKERLQDAILNQGLRPEPEPRSAWPWAWAPALLGALALGVLLLRGPQAPSQREDIVRNAEPAYDLRYLHLGDLADGSNLRFDVVDERAEAAARGDAAEPPAAEEAPPRVVRNAVAPVNHTGRSSGPAHVEAPRPDESIVLIQNERDGQTGALKAIETEAYQGVLIGS